MLLVPIHERRDFLGLTLTLQTEKVTKPDNPMTKGRDLGCTL